MKFNSETPTTAMTAAGKIFKMPILFAEGHVCAANEAAALAQLAIENVRNNVSKGIKKAVEDGTFDHATMQAQIDEYVEGYEFGVRGGRGPTDPVGKAELEIARGIVKTAIRNEGMKVADFDAADITRLAEDLIAEDPNINKTAKKQVEDRAKLGAKVDLSSVKAATPPATQ